jgi:hypothetical protein
VLIETRCLRHTRPSLARAKCGVGAAREDLEIVVEGSTNSMSGDAKEMMMSLMSSDAGVGWQRQ